MSVGRLLEDSLWTSGYSPDVSPREPISQRLGAILSSQMEHHCRDWSVAPVVLVIKAGMFSHCYLP